MFLQTKKIKQSGRRQRLAGDVTAPAEELVCQSDCTVERRWIQVNTFQIIIVLC